jgi:hypothetical protein
MPFGYQNECFSDHSCHMKVTVLHCCFCCGITVLHFSAFSLALFCSSKSFLPVAILRPCH